MKKRILYSAVLIALISCGKDEEADPKDTTAPVVEAVMIEGTNVLTQTTEVEVHLEEAFSFTVATSDDKGLSQMQVEVHEALDDHNHARLGVSSTEPADKDTLSYGPVIRTLSSVSQSETFDVFSATDTNYVSGEYHIEIVVLDAEGNRTEKVVEFHLEDEHEEEHVH